MKIASRRITQKDIHRFPKSRGAWSINQLTLKVDVDPTECEDGDTVRINNPGNGDWSAYGGPNPGVQGDTFVLQFNPTPRGDSGTVDDLNVQIDIGAVPGVMNNYLVWIILCRLRYYSTSLTTGLEWLSWWQPYWFITTMSENVIEELFIPVGSGLPLSEMELSGPNITGILEAFPASDQFDGGDFLPETTYSLPNHLFTSDLLQELGLTDVKSYFALESTEYEGKLANYMRGQILYSFVSLGDRSLSRRKDMGTNYTNYAGDSPFQTSQARFYNYDDVQTGSSNTVLIILIIGLILLAGVFAFLAFYPRGSRLSRFA